MKNCLFCGRELRRILSISFIISFARLEETLICKQCFEKFKRINPSQACPGCSREQSDRRLCSDCRAWQEKYPQMILKHQALFTYNKIAQEYMKEYKIQGDLILAQLFKKEIKKALSPYEKDYHILFLPVSRDSFKNRGFNQVLLLLEAAEVSYQDCLLHKGQGKKQSAKDRHERLGSPQSFAWKGESTLDEKKKNVLLVDDIYTTGRTLLHAKSLVQEKLSTIDGQARAIESFTLFR